MKCIDTWLYRFCASSCDACAGYPWNISGAGTDRPAVQQPPPAAPGDHAPAAPAVTRARLIGMARTGRGGGGGLGYYGYSGRARRVESFLENRCWRTAPAR